MAPNLEQQLLTGTIIIMKVLSKYMLVCGNGIIDQLSSQMSAINIIDGISRIKKDEAAIVAGIFLIATFVVYEADKDSVTLEANLIRKDKRDAEPSAVVVSADGTNQLVVALENGLPRQEFGVYSVLNDLRFDENGVYAIQITMGETTLAEYELAVTSKE